MAYVAQNAIAGKVPPQFLLDALDDDRDGVADAGVWDLIAADVSESIDALLAPSYPVPFAAPLPALVSAAAKVFACEAIYMRRGIAGDPNPWTAEADRLRTLLGRIGSGDLPLSTIHGTADDGGSVIGEGARLHDEPGRLQV